MIDIKKLQPLGGHGLCYPFRKMRKSQEQYPFLSQTLHYFDLIFFFYGY